MGVGNFLVSRVSGPKIDAGFDPRVDLCASTKPFLSVVSFCISFPKMCISSVNAPSYPISHADAAKMMMIGRIQELLNDGLSDSEIVRTIRREAKLTSAWPEMSFRGIKQFIDAAMEESETESTPTFDSDEEDEEYVPEEESEEESEEDTDEESEETTEETVENRIAVLYFDRIEDEDIDRLTITPQGEGVFAVEMAYNLPSSKAHPRYATFFEGDADALELYVADLMRMTAVDDLPFKSVEFSIPFFPNISLKPRSLRKKGTRHTVLRALRQYLEHFENN